MPGNGPLPSPERQRERDTARRERDMTVVRPDNRVRGPQLPKGHTYSDDTVDWYQTWRRSPQAQLFESTDWLALKLLLPLVDANFKRPSAAAISEIRLTTAALGGTYADRLRVAKISIDRGDPDEGAKATVTKIDRRAEARALLKAVPPLPTEKDEPAPF